LFNPPPPKKHRNKITDNNLRRPSLGDTPQPQKRNRNLQKRSCFITFGYAFRQLTHPELGTDERQHLLLNMQTPVKVPINA
jgi:hypothetical protein